MISWEEEIQNQISILFVTSNFLGCTKKKGCKNKSYFFADYKMAEFVFGVKSFSSLENGKVEVYEVDKEQKVDFAILLVKR